MRRQRGDAGFTMMEVIIALGLISVVMAAVGTFFVSSLRSSRYQAQIQTATRLAQAGMESARGYGGPTLLVGRDRCGSCLDLAALDQFGYLRDTVRWDAPVAGTPPTVPVPDTTSAASVVNGVSYYRYYLVGRCWQAAGGGICDTDASRPVPMVRLVIAVTWSSASCSAAMCIRASTSLFSAEPADPVFAR
ncbi:type II secretion system protein [Actinoplanes sp. N902-109]|uniref:type II secretion system protein n=1 Tax=Actinoplanes sp. (strain N902-109) TaxID=649831 RepID=UPI000329638D|nr:type II secretion system protein [Actinoplanes sp. N902-109]AGL15037.1 hypothetical protein L083_1527 [Actinoplanes sp. N902-109]